MNTFICAVLCFGCLGHAQNQESPLESLAEFLLAQHPTKARQGQGPKAVRARKSPAMEGRAMSSFDDSQPANLDVKEMAGVTGPLGFLEPCSDESLTQRVFTLEKSDYAAEWVLKRRLIEEYGSKNPFLASEEFLTAFFAEYDANLLEKPLLTNPNQAEKLRAIIKRDGEARRRWNELVCPEGGGIGTGDPKKLPQEFVEAFLASCEDVQ